jgi:hypothetical protein
LRGFLGHRSKHRADFRASSCSSRWANASAGNPAPAATARERKPRPVGARGGLKRMCWAAPSAGRRRRSKRKGRTAPAPGILGRPKIPFDGDVHDIAADLEPVAVRQVVRRAAGSNR